MQACKPHAEDNQPADEYVENFELDHFDYVKREPSQPARGEHVEILPACACGHWPDGDRPPYVAIAVVSPHTSPPPLGTICRHPADDELHYTREPLDMRTYEELNHREWRQRDYIIEQPDLPPTNSSIMPPRGSHQDYASCDQLISDYMLLTLSVPELHKRLHGFPRRDVTILKKKRRTLKNRGYAQDCRSKRIQKRQELELANRSLQDELYLLQQQVARVTHERDVLKQRLSLLGREHAVPHHAHHAHHASSALHSAQGFHREA